MKSMFSNASNAIASAKAKRASMDAANSLTVPSSPPVVDEKLRKILEKKAPVRVSGRIWKRRDGLGKVASWEFRQMELRGSVLLYYATSEEEQGQEATKQDSDRQPRGYLDLAEEKAVVQISFGESGTPSPFCVSINVGVTAQETKWKLCFDHHQTQTEWLAAISDAVIQCSVDDYNCELLQAANPNKSQAESSLYRPPPVYEPGGKPDDADGADQDNTGRQTFRLWMTDEYPIDKKTADTDAAKREITQSSSPTSTSEEETGRLREAIQERDTKLAKLSTESESFETQLGPLLQAVQEKDTLIAQLSTDKVSLEEEFEISIYEQDILMTEALAENKSLEEELDSLRQSRLENNAKMTEALEEKSSLDKDKDLSSLRQALQEKDEQIAVISAAKEELVVWMEDKHQEELISSAEDYQNKLDAQDKVMADNLGSLQQAIQEKDTQIADMSAVQEEVVVSMEEKHNLLKEELTSSAEEYQKKLDAQENAMEEKLSAARLIKSNEEDDLVSSKEELRVAMEEKLTLLKEELSFSAEMYQNKLDAQEKEMKEKLSAAQLAKSSDEEVLGSLQQAVTEKDAQIAVISAAKEELLVAMEEKHRLLNEELASSAEVYQNKLDAQEREMEEKLSAAQLTKSSDEEVLGSIQQAVKEKDAQIAVISASKEELLVSMEEKHRLLKEELASSAVEYQNKLEAQEKVMEETLSAAQLTKSSEEEVLGSLQQAVKEKDAQIVVMSAAKEELLVSMEEKHSLLKEELSFSAEVYQKKLDAQEKEMEEKLSAAQLTKSSEEEVLGSLQQAVQEKDAQIAVMSSAKEELLASMEEKHRLLKEELASAAVEYQNKLEAQEKVIEQTLSAAQLTKSSEEEVLGSLQQAVQEKDAQIAVMLAAKDELVVSMEEKHSLLKEELSFSAEVYQNKLDAQEKEMEEKLHAAELKTLSDEQELGLLQQAVQEKDAQIAVMSSAKEELIVSMDERHTLLTEELASSAEMYQKQINAQEMAMEETLSAARGTKSSDEENLGSLQQAVQEKDAEIAVISAGKEELRVAMEEKYTLLKEELSFSAELYQNKLDAQEKEMEEKLNAAQLAKSSDEEVLGSLQQSVKEKDAQITVMSAATEELHVAMEEKQRLLKEELASSAEEYQKKLEAQEKEMEETLSAAQLTKSSEEYDLGSLQQAVKEKDAQIAVISAANEELIVSMEEKHTLLKEELAFSAEVYQKKLDAQEKEMDEKLSAARHIQSFDEDYLGSLQQAVKEKDAQIAVMSAAKEELLASMEEGRSFLQEELSSSAEEYQKKLDAQEKVMEEKLSAAQLTKSSDEEAICSLEGEVEERKEQIAVVLRELRAREKAIAKNIGSLQNEIEEKDDQIAVMSAVWEETIFDWEEKHSLLTEELASSSKEYQNKLDAQEKLTNEKLFDASWTRSSNEEDLGSLQQTIQEKDAQIALISGGTKELIASMEEKHTLLKEELASSAEVYQKKLDAQEKVMEEKLSDARRTKSIDEDDLGSLRQAVEEKDAHNTVILLQLDAQEKAMEGNICSLQNTIQEKDAQITLLSAAKEELLVSMDEKVRLPKEALSSSAGGYQNKPDAQKKATEEKLIDARATKSSDEDDLGSLQQAIQEKDAQITLMSAAGEELLVSMEERHRLLKEELSSSAEEYQKKLDAQAKVMEDTIGSLQQAIQEKDAEITLTSEAKKESLVSMEEETKLLKDELSSLAEEYQKKLDAQAKVMEEKLSAARRTMSIDEDLGSLQQAIQEKDAQITVISAAKEELLVSMEERNRLLKEELSSSAEEYQRKLDAQEKVMEVKLRAVRRSKSIEEEDPGSLHQAIQEKDAQIIVSIQEKLELLSEELSPSSEEYQKELDAQETIMEAKLRAARREKSADEEDFGSLRQAMQETGALITLLSARRENPTPTVQRRV